MQRTQLQSHAVYGHSVPTEAEDRWEPLIEHLERVASLASAFAAAFDSAGWGHLAGLWHDLGKYQPSFQARLRGSREQVEHAGLGAALAASRGIHGMPLAFAIAGHHSGLANREAQGDTGLTPLRLRLERSAGTLESIRSLIPAELIDAALPRLPRFLEPLSRPIRSEQERFAARIELWIRFLFSALIDADRLATEAFYQPQRRASAVAFDDITGLRRRLDRRLDTLPVRSDLDELRREILAACRSAAERPPGLFSLTVPTGGGKTLASMAFALRHAERYGMRRVIVVIPYTSIIEQNAQVYREMLDARNVLEHHSNLELSEQRDTRDESEVWRELAVENWDAPVVVTTNVQFFESLLSNRPSRCRRIHNIARSVVILDEAQNLPIQYLLPVVDVLRELTAGYGCSVTLMSATQPVLSRRAALPDGLENVHEIIPNPERLATRMTRVAVEWPVNEAATGFEVLAGEVADYEQALVIVHLRKDARELAKRLPERHRYHLSALMCPAHRSQVLSEVKSRLREGLPCRLVATQLVEAGVDVDFPVVFRALAGLDSLAQAAGRCNREGWLKDANGSPTKGRFVIFRAATRPPAGVLRRGLETTEALLREHGPALDFQRPDLLEDYFRMLYSKCDLDANGVQTERRQLNFATVGEKLRLIEDDHTRPVVVPWGDSPARVERFVHRPSRATQRALQPFLIQIPERSLNVLLQVGGAESISESLWSLTTAFAHLYDPVWGLVVDEDAHAEPGALLV